MKTTCIFFVNLFLLVLIGFANNAYSQVKSTSTQTQITGVEESCGDARFSKDIKDAEEYLKTIRDFSRNKSFPLPENAATREMMARSLSKDIETFRKNGDVNGALQVSGQLCRVNGDTRCAIDAFSKVISVSENNSYKSYISADRGLVYYEQGDSTAALNDFSYVLNSKTLDKPYAAVELGVKLGKMAEAKTLFDEWIAYKRSKTPFYVARTTECDIFEKAGTPVSGCFNQKMFVCFNRSKTGEPKGDCSVYDGEIEYLNKTDFCQSCHNKK